MLIIKTLGKVNISHRGEDISEKLSHKMVALICLLVIYNGREAGKEKIAAYFWPDSDDEASKYNLRYSLWMIRKLIPKDKKGESLITVGKDSCRINEKYDFTCDKILLDRFQAKKGSSIQELEELRHQFQGDFLEGLYLKNCNEFNELILFERVVCQNKQIQILKELADLYEKAGKREDELVILKEMAMIEPYNETFVCRIMEALAAIGNRPAAIQAYKRFETVLRRDLNIQPEQHLKAIHASMLTDPCVGNPDGTKVSITNRKRIHIKVRCMKGVDYFLLAGIVSELLRVADKSYIMDIEEQYLLDLGFIQNELLLAYEAQSSRKVKIPDSVPDVRIINAFCKFIHHVSQVYEMDIDVVDALEIDVVSQNIIKHVRQTEPLNQYFHFSFDADIM